MGDGLFRAEGTRGTCRVVCFSPRHDLTLADLDEAAIRRIVDVWAEQTTELGERYRWIQVFENRGAAMGASNPHPHGQIWAGRRPAGRGPLRGGATQVEHLAATGTPAAARLRRGRARWAAGRPRRRRLADARAVLGRRGRSRRSSCRWSPRPARGPRRPAARDGLAAALRDLNRRYDALFRRPFPFSMGWHQAPFGEADELGTPARIPSVVAGPRPLLPAAPPGVGAQVHGRLRAADRAAARPDARGGRRAGCATPPD